MKVITYLNKLTPENNKVYVFKTTIDEAIICYRVSTYSQSIEHTAQHPVQ